MRKTTNYIALSFVAFISYTCAYPKYDNLGDAYGFFPSYVGNSSKLDANTTATYRVAFLGNSMMYYNDLPRIVGELFEYSGYGFERQNVLRGSATLSSLWDKANDECIEFWANLCPFYMIMGATSLFEMIEDEGPWDYIVINDFSQHPARPETRNESVQVLRDHYAPLFAQQRINPVFVQTWAYRDEGIEDSGDLGGYKQFTQALVDGYQEYEDAMNNEFRALFGTKTPTIRAYTAHVGQAYAEMKDSDNDLWLRMYSPDGKHPNALGTLMAAYLIFWTITGEAPPEEFHLRWLITYKRIREWKVIKNFDFELPTDEEAREVWEMAQKVYLQNHPQTV